MDSSLDLCFNYNPFEDIQQNRQTIWRLDVFEESVPPLMTDDNFLQTDEQINSTKCLSQSMSNLSDTLAVTHKNRSYASGDHFDLWSSVPQTLDLMIKQKQKRKYENSFCGSKPNLIRFPEKLWTIIEECDTGAIQWSPNGMSIVIDYSIFQKHYLNDFSHFKTHNMASFVRQLNLYGFHKINLKTRRRPISLSPINENRQSTIINKPSDPLMTSNVANCSQKSEGIEANDDCHEFKCDFFRRDRKDLMCKMQRKYSCFPNERNCQNLKHNHQKKPKNRIPLKPTSFNHNRSKSKISVKRERSGQTCGRRCGQSLNGVSDHDSIDTKDFFCKYSMTMNLGDSSDGSNVSNEKSDHLSMTDTSHLFTSFL